MINWLFILVRIESRVASNFVDFLATCSLKSYLQCPKPQYYLCDQCKMFHTFHCIPATFIHAVAKSFFRVCHHRLIELCGTWKLLFCLSDTVSCSYQELLKPFFFTMLLLCNFFTWGCSIYHRIYNRIHCFLCAPVCFLLVSLKLLYSLPDVKCRSCFPLTLSRNLFIHFWL